MFQYAHAGVVAPDVMPQTISADAQPAAATIIAMPAKQTIAKPRPAAKTASIDEIVSTAPDDKRKKYTLRCWQNGLLIMERPVNAAPPDSAKAVSLDGEAGSAMRLFDLRNAMCLLQ